MTLTVYPDRLRRNIAAAVNSAAAGAKRNAGYAVVNAAFPAGSTVQLLRDGVVAFATTMPSVPVLNGVMTFPNSYGVATTLGNADIDTGTWTLKLTSGTNTLTGSVTKTGGAGPFFLTDDTITSKGLSWSGITFSLPSTLDVVAATGTVSIDEMLADMSLESVIPFPDKYNKHAVCLFPVNYDAVVGICNWQGTERTKFDEYYNATDVWAWIYYAPGNTSSGKRVQIRNLRHSLLRKSTGLWEEYPVINRFSDLQMYIGNRPTPDLGLGQMLDHLRTEPDGNSVILDNANMGAEMWAEGFSQINDHNKMVDSKCWMASCQVRVINNDGTPYTGSDAKYTIQLGYDLFYTGMRSAPGTEGAYGKHSASSATGQQDYPLFVADGGASRWKQFDGSMGWTNIGVIAGYTGTRETVNGIGAIPPWGNYSTPPWPYNKAPYCLTEAEIRANHPAWMY